MHLVMYLLEEMVVILLMKEVRREIRGRGKEGKKKEEMVRRCLPLTTPHNNKGAGELAVISKKKEKKEKGNFQFCSFV